MTQEQLAEAVGLARGSIANLERGTQAPTAFRMAVLAQALGCSPGDLMPDPKSTLALGKFELSEALQHAVDSVRRAGARKQSKGARR
jgi:transcriptional regulator with XRE-family HTH domain